MGDLIRVDFKKRQPVTMSLTEAKAFLGNSFFKQALLVWSVEYLEKTVNHSECCLSGADAAYEAVLRFRLGHTSEPARGLAKVYQFPAAKAA